MRPSLPCMPSTRVPADHDPPADRHGGDEFTTRGQFAKWTMRSSDGGARASAPVRVLLEKSGEAVYP